MLPKESDKTSELRMIKTMQEIQSADQQKSVWKLQFGGVGSDLERPSVDRNFCVMGHGFFGLLV